MPLMTKDEKRWQECKHCKEQNLHWEILPGEFTPEGKPKYRKFHADGTMHDCYTIEDGEIVLKPETLAKMVAKVINTTKPKTKLPVSKRSTHKESRKAYRCRALGLRMHKKLAAIEKLHKEIKIIMSKREELIHAPN